MEGCSCARCRLPVRAHAEGAYQAPGYARLARQLYNGGTLKFVVVTSSLVVLLFRAGEFKQRLDAEFDFMVAPLVSLCSALGLLNCLQAYNSGHTAPDELPDQRSCLPALHV